MTCYTRLPMGYSRCMLPLSLSHLPHLDSRLRVGKAERCVIGSGILGEVRVHVPKAVLHR